MLLLGKEGIVQKALFTLTAPIFLSLTLGPWVDKLGEGRNQVQTCFLVFFLNLSVGVVWRSCWDLLVLTKWSPTHVRMFWHLCEGTSQHCFSLEEVVPWGGGEAGRPGQLGRPCKWNRVTVTFRVWRFFSVTSAHLSNSLIRVKTELTASVQSERARNYFLLFQPEGFKGQLMHTFW